MRTPLRLCRLLLFIIALCMGLLATAQAQPDLKHAARADTLLKQGRFTEAIGHYDKAIQANNKEYRYLYRRGFAKMSARQFEKAKDDFFAALQLNPECDACYSDLGALELESGNPRAALGFLNSAIKLKKSAHSYFLRAQAREALGNDVETLIDYNYAIQFDSTVIEFRIAKGLYYLNAKNPEMAREIFNDVIARAPDSTAGYYNRARVSSMAERWSDVLEDIDKVIALDKTFNSNAYMARGSALAELKRFAEAHATYDTVIARMPEYGLGYFYRAMVKYKMEDMDGSCDDINRSLALMKKNDPKNELIGYAARTLDNHCDTSRPSYYYQRGIALYNMNRFDEAIDAYNRGLKRFNENPLFYYFRGNANLARKNFAEAAKDYERALSDEKNLVAEYTMTMGSREGVASADMKGMAAMLILGIYSDLAASKGELKDYDGAIAVIDKAIELGRTTGAIDVALGYIRRGGYYLIKGENRKALEDFDKGLELQPSLVAGHMNRAIALANIAQQRPIKTRTFFAGVQGGNQPPVRFDLPASIERVDDSGELRQAIGACTRVIELDPTEAQAYSLRGFLRLMISSPDACADLEKARSLGDAGAADLFANNCK